MFSYKKNCLCQADMALRMCAPHLSYTESSSFRTLRSHSRVHREDSTILYTYHAIFIITVSNNDSYHYIGR